MSDAGYQVDIAYDGQKGLSAILSDAPDLVLSDISMPGMSGFEVLQRLISLAPRFERMPFIFLTALANREDELKGRRSGADDYVTKPIDFEILCAIIAARLAGVARTEIWKDDTRLTEREAETLAWIARGKTSSEIANILGLTKRTVDFHADMARSKLGVATRTEAAVKAVLRGIIKT